MSEQGRGAMGCNYFVTGSCLLSLSIYRRGLQDMLKIRKCLLHRLKERR